MAAEDKSKDGGSSGGEGSITVRLQSKDRDSTQEFSLHRVRLSSSSSLHRQLSVCSAAAHKLMVCVCVCVCVCVFQDAPLGSIFSQYLSRMSSRAQGTVRFHFDGCKVTHSQTPAQLDMEDGDIIEVWI